VTVTSNGANMSFMHWTVAAQFAAEVFQAGTDRAPLMMLERFVRASSSPGWSVMPFLFR